MDGMNTEHSGTEDAIESQSSGVEDTESSSDESGGDSEDGEPPQLHAGHSVNEGEASKPAHDAIWSPETDVNDCEANRVGDRRAHGFSELAIDADPPEKMNGRDRLGSAQNATELSQRPRGPDSNLQPRTGKKSRRKSWAQTARRKVKAGVARASEWLTSQIFRKVFPKQRTVVQEPITGVKRLLLDAAPYILLVIAILITVLLITTSRRSVTYAASATPPLDISCLEAGRQLIGDARMQQECLFVISGAQSMRFQGIDSERTVMSHNGSAWLVERDLSLDCLFRKDKIGADKVLTSALAAVLSPRIYVVGVAGDGCVQSYSGGDAWQAEPGLPEQMRREGASLVSFKNALWLVGGFTRGKHGSVGSENVDWVTTFKPKELQGDGVWLEAPPLPTARSGIATCVGFGRLFAIGAFAPFVCSLLFFLAHVLNCHVKAAICRGPRMRKKGLTCGVGKGGSYSAEVQSFDGVTWRTEPALHTRLTGADAVYFNGKIWAIGGFSYGKAQKNVEAFNAISWCGFVVSCRMKCLQPAHCARV